MDLKRSLADFVNIINSSSIEWVAENIHPYVVRDAKDTNASYLRKMALWMMATNTLPETRHDTNNS